MQKHFRMEIRDSRDRNIHFDKMSKSNGFYFFNHLSNQPKKVRCQRIPFWGLSTQ